MSRALPFQYRVVVHVSERSSRRKDGRHLKSVLVECYEKFNGNLSWFLCENVIEMNENTMCCVIKVLLDMYRTGIHRLCARNWIFLLAYLHLFTYAQGKWVSYLYCALISIGCLQIAIVILIISIFYKAYRKVYKNDCNKILE